MAITFSYIETQLATEKTQFIYIKKKIGAFLHSISPFWNYASVTTQ